MKIRCVGNLINYIQKNKGTSFTQCKSCDKGEKQPMENIIYDHQIVGIAANKAENFSESLVYKHQNRLHQIDFEECARNYAEEHETSSGRCIGERNIEEGYFLFFTNGIKTKIVFKKAFVMDFGHHFLHGTKRKRFFQLKNRLMQSKYTTYDLT